MKLRKLFVCLVFSTLTVLPASAQEVWITEDTPFFEFRAEGRDHVIERNQDQEARLNNSVAKTSRACPPFCVHPMVAAEGVETVGELELLEFLTTHVVPGSGLLVDSRLPEWFEAGTIPGAVNLPFNLFNPSSDRFFGPIMRELGGRETAAGWDFVEARHLLLFCNGPWCDQSPRAIRNLVDAGYPADRIRYYRGGMQSWLSLGFGTLVPAAS